MNNINNIIKNNSMSRYQIVAVSLCVILYMLDGFDVLVMAFTAAPVAKEWGLQASQVGLLLSAGLFGMTGGSLFIAPLADKFGRRALVLSCLVIISVGMGLSAFANSMVELGILRLVTGLGIGGMLATLTVVASEYSSAKWNNFILSLLGVGYPIGAVVGGSIAAVLMLHYDWRSVFLFGSLVSFFLIPLALLCLPESLDFLLSKRPANALQKINLLMTRMGHQALASLPPLSDSGELPQTNLRSLFAPEVRRSTLLIWLAFFMVMFSFYFVLSWTPKLLVAAGLSTAEGISGGVLINLGGITGGLLLGYISSRFSLRKILMIYMFATTVLMLAFGLFWSQLTLALGLGVIMGFFLFGSMIGLYILTPAKYATSIRTTGMGWAIGIGRLGAIFSPIIAGFLLEQQWQSGSLFMLFSMPLLCAMVAVYFVSKDAVVDKTADYQSDTVSAAKS
ncbi:MFS transporter [Dasania marina]|uniref:MFS transporter n=1 Tax=Dasania marina TaxID=471499 RepID=UPI0030DCEA5C|tara:strand:+ start:2883 stop:4235 length:1353 start_codon:yes stop_codon:yes gene_type:complete